MDLFNQPGKEVGGVVRPLADRMRPETLADFVGQTRLLGKGSLLRRAIEDDRLFSVIFWGPPDSGKTTLARIMAGETESHFETFSAVLSGVKEIRAVVDEARGQRRYHQKKTLLFVDEIHRFNKAQQDAFLPHVEKGTILLIGATTENPSFEINSALLSRCRVYVLERLSTDHILAIMDRALADAERGLGNYKASVERNAMAHIANFADGDARRALNALELAVEITPPDSSGERPAYRPG